MVKLDLHLYINKETKPVVFAVANIVSKDEVKYLEKNSMEIYSLLIENKIIKIDTILIFVLVKQFNKKKSFMIQHSIKSNNKLVEIFEKKTDKVEELSFDVLTKSLTKYLLNIDNNLIKINIHKSNSTDS